MKLKLKACLALVALFTSALAFAGGEGWSSDFAAAQKEATESNKDLLIDFTGSDWCGWCIKLNKEVFSHQPFKDGVKDKFVLVELDYPKDKSKLSEATIQQNEELGKKYGVQGYPTILLADASGKPYAKTGYQKGGPESYVAHLDELRARKTVRDESFKAAESASGVEKAKALVAALKAMDLEDTMVANFYGDVADQIKAADPKDETGFTTAAEAKERIEKFQGEFSGLAQKGDFEGAMALLDKTLKDGGFDAAETQKLMATRGMVFAQQQKFDEAIKAVGEAKAFAPDSEIAADLDGFIQKLEEAKAKGAGGAEEKPAAE
jgi:thioredoxin-related protein